MKILTRLESLERRFRDIEAELSDPEVGRDPSRYQKLAKEAAALRPLIDSFSAYRKIIKEEEELKQSLAEKGIDPEMKKLYEEELRSLLVQRDEIVGALEDKLLRDADPNRGRDCIVEIRAGTGGEEAALFVANLFRMYSKYAAARKLKTEIMDSNPTGKGGFREIIFGVSGQQAAFGAFKYESGIHRVQRVPETEANGRIHTSAVTVAVLPEADETEININPADLKIDVFRASGAGGQHVNKTESAVRITHLPTGFVVSCQDERSQHKNKAKAMRVLRARLYDAVEAKHQNEIAKQRKEQVGTGDRSGKIRTYNFPDQRVTDHRIGLTLHALDDILNGHLDDLISALERDEKDRKLSGAAPEGGGNAS